MTEVEETLKFDMTLSRAIIVDLLILGVILCAFFAGYWYGQRTEAQEKNAFFTEYIYNSCECNTPLVKEGDKYTYEKVVVKDDMFDFIQT